MINYSYSKKVGMGDIIYLYGAVKWIDEEIARKSGKSLSELAIDISDSFRNSQVVVSACDNGKLVGIVRGITDKIDMGLIIGLAVHPDFRKQGIGGELLKRCTAKYSEVKWCLSSSQEAEKFYSEQGFKESREKGFSNGGGLF